jgi:hypothetical protein
MGTPVPNVKVNKLPREVSDHNPLVLSTDIQVKLRHLRFRFELAWLKNPVFLEKVKEIWGEHYHAESACDRIQRKLKKFKQYFKGWEFNRQGAQKKRKMVLQDEIWKLEQIEEDALLSPDQAANKTKWLGELMTILEEEELYWYKRAHETWLHEGDNNTEYFHRIANGRRRKKHNFLLGK